MRKLSSDFDELNASEAHLEIMRIFDAWKSLIADKRSLILEKVDREMDVTARELTLDAFEYLGKSILISRDTAINILGDRKSKKSLDQIRSHLRNHLQNCRSEVISQTGRIFESETLRVEHKKISLERKLFLVHEVSLRRKDELSKLREQLNSIKGKMRKENNQISKFKEHHRLIDDELRLSFKRSLNRVSRSMDSSGERFIRFETGLKLLSLLHEAQRT